MRINLHLYPSSLTNESRILKTTKSIESLNTFDAIDIIGLSGEGLQEFEQLSKHRRIWRVKCKIPLMLKIKTLTLFIEWYLRIFFTYLNKNVQIIHCNSINDLPIGVLLKIFKRKIKLIYDCQELETETNWLQGTNKKFKQILEKNLIKFVDHVIVVSPSIAEWHRRQYKIDKVSVVRNVPYVTQSILHPSSILKKKLNIPEEEILYIYQGGLYAARGIPLLLDIFSALSSRHIVFMGYGDMEPTIKEFSFRYKNIHFFPAVKPEEVLSYTSGADIGIHLIENTCLNHYFSLPNKIFEYILSGIPVLIKDYPDMAAVIDQYDCGWKVPDDKTRIIEMIKNISINDITNKKINSLNAHKTMGWQFEERVLLDVYTNLLNPHK